MRDEGDPGVCLLLAGGWLKRALKAGKKFENPVPVTVGGLSMVLKVLPRYLTNREEREPKEPLGPFRTDSRVYLTAPLSGLRVTWMGHSSSLVEIDGTRLLIDPMWDERASPFGFMGPKRFFAPPLRLEELPPVDAVLISHDHYDHLGKRTVRELARLQPGARWITSLGVGAILRGFGVAGDRIYELDWTESVAVEECRVTALPARHFSGRGVTHRFETLWSSFVLKGPKHTVYYGADSGEWEGFAEIGAAHGPFDLTMLEIGAYDELWKDIHMGPDGAVRSFAALSAAHPESAGMLMPVHWGLFDLALHGWRQPMERLAAVAAERGIPLWAPEPGRPAEVVRGVALGSDWWR